MPPFRRLALSTVILLVASSATLALSSEHPLAKSQTAVSHLATAPSGSSPAVSYSQEVPLWPEDSQVIQDGIKALAHEEWSITNPSLLIYPAQKKSARPAILIFPGGGFKALAIGQKSTLGFLGADVCNWLTDAGVTCIIVKYRVPNTACNWNSKTKRHETPEIPMALQDTQRAISMVRY